MTPPSARWIRSEPLKSAHGPSSPNGETRRDQRRKLLRQRGGAESVPVELAARRRFQQHVRGGEECLKPLAIVGLAQVKDDRPFPAVVLPEEERTLGIILVLVEGTDATGRTPTRRFDLDDVGAEPGER